MVKNHGLQFLPGKSKAGFSIVRGAGEREQKRTAPKADAILFAEGSSGMILLGSPLVLFLLQEWNHLQWRKSVCGQVIIHHMETTWGRASHMQIGPRPSLGSGATGMNAAGVSFQVAAKNKCSAPKTCSKEKSM